MKDLNLRHSGLQPPALPSELIWQKETPKSLRIYMLKFYHYIINYSLVSFSPTIYYCVDPIYKGFGPIDIGPETLVVSMSQTI